MDFDLEYHQRGVADLAAAVLRGDSDDARVRAALAGELGYDEVAWKALGQAGLLLLALPETMGGDGLGMVEVGLLLTEVGRQLLPLPALAALALGVLPVVRHGSSEQQAALLSEVADRGVLTAALRDATEDPVTMRDGALSGVRIGVPYAAQAFRMLVPLEHETAVIDPAGAGVTLERTFSSTGAPEYSVRLADVAPESVLAASAAEIDRFAVAGAAAVADGVLAGALQLTAEHLRTRQQFGRPLASFQAVAQQIADVYVVARTVHLAAVSAAWRMDNGVDPDEDLAVAAYWVAAEVPRALQICHHLHGGLGVDITYPLHRYFSHGTDLARFVGGAAARLDALGDRCCSN